MQSGRNLTAQHSIYTAKKVSLEENFGVVTLVNIYTKLKTVFIYLLILMEDPFYKIICVEFYLCCENLISQLVKLFFQFVASQSCDGPGKN